MLALSRMAPLLGGVPPSATLCTMCRAQFGQRLCIGIRSIHEVRKLFGCTCGKLEPLPPKHCKCKCKKKKKNSKNNGPKPKNNRNPTPQVPRPDISKARKVTPNLNYPKVVQNIIPQEHVSPPTPAPSKDASKIHEVRDFVHEQNLDMFLARRPRSSWVLTPRSLTIVSMKTIELEEVIADSLQEQFEPNHVTGRKEFAQRTNTEVENFLTTPHVQEIEPTAPTEILAYVQRIKPKKSPGLDQISNHSWKTVTVIPILKPDKNPEIAQNYRLISLLSSLSKVYEFVLLWRLNQHCAASNFIIPQQCGFCPHCSTVHQLLIVTELIHSGFEKHVATGIFFLDIAKAFDKIWHEGLIIKLIRLDFPAPLIKSIHSFFSHRSFRVRVNRILSSPRPIKSGLPQGSLCFLLCT
ncbi:RNA-directed DNA polymerase from mobile element jockey [Trichonephila clavipes]|nr:RNA-directed DNA polymerase from mobile element jockey [Trichonephila clavipes]